MQLVEFEEAKKLLNEYKISFPRDNKSEWNTIGLWLGILLRKVIIWSKKIILYEYTYLFKKKLQISLHSILKLAILILFAKFS